MKYTSLLALLLFFFRICFSQDYYEVIIPTFLGSEQRNYYGENAPDSLNLIWKTNLGCGLTVLPNANRDTVQMCGAGWTGQALLIKEDGRLFVVQGAYDYNLRKIDAETGKVIWEYPYDDVIKSSGCVWVDTSKSENHPDRILILQGSRRGFGKSLYETHIGSYKAVSFGTGKEKWQLDIPRTQSFSRDTDGTGLVLGDTVFLGQENGYLTVFQPNPDKTVIKNGVNQPVVLEEYPLYLEEDVRKHFHNIVVESSPSLLNNHIYIPCGSGHVYGFNRITRTLDWDFYVGSDLDGSAIVTRDSCILISVEKQYINGIGGVLKLNPNKNPEVAVEWYHQSQDSLFADWAGGIIGSVAINDSYISENENAMAAFVGIDGELHVVDHEFLATNDSTTGPDGNTCYPIPQSVFNYHVGASISTPIFTENRLIVASYNGLFLFGYNDNCIFTLLDHYDIVVEATPVVYNKKIYVAARDGYLYCIGQKK